jgi:DNA-binding sugar fermentation-stimulating protein
MLPDALALEELPGVEHLRSLEKLKASGCGKLKSIQVFKQLTKLRELDVIEGLDLEELQGVEHLKSLEKLKASGHRKLNSIIS